MAAEYERGHKRAAAVGTGEGHRRTPWLMAIGGSTHDEVKLSDGWVMALKK